MINFRKYVIILITQFLATITFAASVGAYNYGCSSASIQGRIGQGGDYGYVLEHAVTGENGSKNIVGYRFSVVNGDGTKISKVVDIYRLN